MCLCVCMCAYVSYDVSDDQRNLILCVHVHVSHYANEGNITVCLCVCMCTYVSSHVSEGQRKYYCVCLCSCMCANVSYHANEGQRKHSMCLCACMCAYVSHRADEGPSPSPCVFWGSLQGAGLGPHSHLYNLLGGSQPGAW